MPVILGSPDTGGFHIDLSQRAPQHPGIINMNPDHGGGGGYGGPSQMEMMQYQAENQAARQTQGAQLQAWLSQQQLTQHEQMELQRNQNAAAYVQNDENLTEPERQELLMQIYTRTSPLQARQRQEQLQHQQMVNEQVMHQNAQMVSMQNMDATARAEHIREHTVTFEDGTRIYTSPNGREHIIPPHDHQGQQDQREDTAREAHEQKWHAERRHAEQQARQELSRGEGGAPPDESAITDRADAIMRRHGIAPNIGDHMRPWDEGHPSRRRRPGPTGGPATTPPGGQQAASGTAGIASDLNRIQAALQPRPGARQSLGAAMQQQGYPSWLPNYGMSGE